MYKLYQNYVYFLCVLVLLCFICLDFYYSYGFEKIQSNNINKFQINGAGASFPFPLIDLWRTKYINVNTEINLNYQSIGSGGGIKQHIEKTIQFAATDVPLTKNEAKLAPNTLHIPETLGAIAVIYNIPEIPHKGLKLTGVNLAEIYMGEITMWNDPKIKIHNPEVDLPNERIIPIRRSDSSGTTFIFTDYLSKLSNEFYIKVGAGKSVPLGNGVAVIGNEGVTNIVENTFYSIGYVELAYALQTNISFAYIENADQTNFVEPTIDSISSAASMMAYDMPHAYESWDGITITDSPGIESYPLSSFTYLIIYDDLYDVVNSKEHAIGLANLFYWMLTEGQNYSKSLFYVPLPEEIVKLSIDGIINLKYDGELLINDTKSPHYIDNYIPIWIKHVAQWWIDDMISDQEYIDNINYLLTNKIIK